MMKTILFLLLLMIYKPLMADEIIDIRTGTHPDKIRLVIDFTGEANFQAATTNKNTQLIVTLPSKSFTHHKLTPLTVPFDGLYHKDIGSDYTQLTFPLISPHTIKSAFILQGNPHRLVIDLISEPSNSSNTQIFGPLIIDENSSYIPPNKKPLIIIDAGHGGQDPGAISPYGIKEKDITLSLAKNLKKALKDTKNYDVLLTRENDIFLSLQDRVAFARDHNAALFLSLHADSINVATVSGASLYTLSDTASDEQTAKLAARENSAGSASNNNGTIDSSVAALLIDLSVRETQNQSKTLAQNLVTGLKSKNISLLDNPHRHAAFAVLKAPEIPSVLIEAGFLSNQSQAVLMLENDFQTNFATAITNALNTYFGFQHD